MAANLAILADDLPLRPRLEFDRSVPVPRVVVLFNSGTVVTAVEAAVAAAVEAAASTASTAVAGVVGSAGSSRDTLGKLADALDGHAGDSANPHRVSKAQVGLGNVANLAPADLPISDAVAAALGLKATQADIAAAFAQFTAGSPEELNTFLEAFNRFLADETALSTLTGLVASKADANATTQALILKANTADLGTAAGKSVGPGTDQVAPGSVPAVAGVKAPYVHTEYPDGRFIDMYDNGVGGRQRDKPAATRNYRKVFQAALESGDGAILVPRLAGAYPFRDGGVDVAGDAPIDLRFGSGARIRAGQELATISNGAISGLGINLIRISTTALDAASAAYGPAAGNRVPIAIQGYTFDTYELDDKFIAAGLRPADTGVGIGGLDISRAFQPVVRDIAGFGKAIPGGTGPVDFSSIDTVYGEHACYETDLDGCYGERHFDLVAYISGTQDTFTIGPDPFTATQGANGVTFTAPDSAMEALLAGSFVWVTGSTDGLGLSLTNADTQQQTARALTRVSGNTFSIPTNVGGTASASGSWGGTIVTIRPSGAVRRGKMDGEGGTFRNVRGRFGSSLIQSKRCHVGAKIRDAVGYNLINGVGNYSVDRTPSHGAYTDIRGLVLKNIVGVPVSLVGPGNRIDGFDIENFGRHLKTLAITGSTREVGAIISDSSRDLIIGAGRIRQTPAWAAQAGDAITLFGVVFRALAMYGVGTIRPTMKDRVLVDGVHRAFFSASGTDGAVIVAPEATGTTLADIYGGANERVTRPVFTIAPVLSFDGGGTAVMTWSLEARLEDSRLIFKMDGTVASLGGTPAGNCRIVGMPASLSPGRTPLTVSRQTLKGTGAIVAYIQASSGTINLFVETNGAYSGIAASTVAVGDRISVSGSYLIDP